MEVSIPNLGAFDVISSADLKVAVARAVEARILKNGQPRIAETLHCGGVDRR